MSIVQLQTHIYFDRSYLSWSSLLMEDFEVQTIELETTERTFQDPNLPQQSMVDSQPKFPHLILTNHNWLILMHQGPSYVLNDH